MQLDFIFDYLEAFLHSVKLLFVIVLKYLVF